MAAQGSSRQRIGVAIMALALVVAAFLGAMLGFVVDFGTGEDKDTEAAAAEGAAAGEG